MSKSTSSLPPSRLIQSGSRWGIRAFVLVFFCVVLLWTDIFAGWTATPAHAATRPNPNPVLTAPSWLTGTGPGTHPDLGQYIPAANASTQPASTSSQPHSWIVSMKPVRLALTNAATHFVSNDGHLSVDVAAGSLATTQAATVQQAQARGALSLVVTQVKPASGGLRSDHVFFGTYEFQWFDAQGQPLSGVRLSHPLAITLHLSPDQQQLVWKGQPVYSVWTAVQGSPTLSALSALSTTRMVGKQVVQTGVEPLPASTQAPMLNYAQADASGLNWTVQSTLSTTTAATTAGTQPAPTVSAVQASSVTFGTQAPQATWGTPSDFQVGLNSGGLNYSSPLSIPPGPGGLQPALALNYTSGSVNENHNVQATAPWVGQGWSLDLGSISWAQENITPNSTNRIENVWHISDPSGIGGQLVPPDLSYSTSGTLNPSLSQLNSGTYIWHTAPESHAKVQEVAFGSYPCWQVWLPNGVMEEFGCTNDSRQAYADSQGVWHMDKWQLDLMIDRYGNQVHVSYQKHTVNNAVLDSAIADITYDDPGCHNTNAACSSWHPQVDIHFDAGQKVTRLLAGNCGNWTPPNANVRCDDPADYAGSGGLPAPKVMGAYVLNDVQVKVNGNLLREYDLSYNQGGGIANTDPATGQKEGIAGFLTLMKVAVKGTGGTVLNAPTLSMQYQGISEHYSDLFSYATLPTNCSPYAAAPRDASPTGPCYLWGMTYHQYYLTNLDNGEGWNESIAWKEAHANTWGLDGAGAVNDAFACTNQGQTSRNNCGRADDKNWSWIAVASRTATTNGVSSTWHYYDYLQSNIQGASIPGYSALNCTSVCRQSYTWGNQNDDDYADYYNGDFQSFAKVQVIQPDGSSQTHTYGATTGWGLTNGNITCYVPFPAGRTCSVASYNSSGSWGLATVFSGKQQQEQDYDAHGNLLKQMDWSWLPNCPPLGVAGSVGAVGGSYDPGPQYLFSELDEGSNPVMVCDPRVDHVDTYVTDGVTSNINDARVVHSTVHTSYDGDNQGVRAYDYGNVDSVDTTGNDVGGQHFVQTTSYFPSDNVGGNLYLTDLPAFVQTRNAAGTIDGCQVYVYGSNPSAPHAPVIPAVTQQAGFTDATNCGGTASVTQHRYDSSGNPIGAIDADGHLGCTSGSAQYSACASYDGSDTHLTKAVNAKNQVVSYGYNSSASGGYGQWLMSTTDANGQATSYTYDALGRLTTIIQPGDTPSQPTTSYTYTRSCNPGTTSPCLELDTTTRETSGSATTTTTRQWYDGMGRLVETQAPGPNEFSKVPAVGSLLVTYTIYDTMGRATTQSLPYAIAATAAMGYVAPDLSQARTVTSYDTQGRPLGSVSYGSGSIIFSKSTINYTVAQGIPSFNVDTSTAFERTSTLDAYNHQSVQYTDALGRDRYEQVFSGTGNPYSVVRTVQYNRDTAGNVTSVVTYNNASVGLARYNAIFDGLKRVTGYNDWDQGDCNHGPMPASCSSTSDTAWKYSYDANSNILSQTDPRNVTTYTSYDGLDRPLCHGTASSQVNPCGSGAYAAFFYDSYDTSSNAGVTFPSGCTAPGGTSAPVGAKVAETFSNAAGTGWRCTGYDARGQTTAGVLSVTADGQTTTQNVSMTYNDLGAINSLTYPDGETVTSNYDGNGRLRSAYLGTAASSDPVAFLVGQVGYINSGQLAGLAIGGTGNKSSVPTALFSTALGYDGMQRPVSSSATLSGASSAFWSQQRTYDNAGNILQLATTLPTSSGGSLVDNQSFCYDALDRLMWAGNTGTPSGGDHCGSTPGGSTTPGYSQSFSYDGLDRMTLGSAGTESYGDSAHVHAATGLSTIPNPYASYDAMGNMTCRNVDASGSQSCASGTQTGATMSYDNAGRLTTWTASSGMSSSDQFLYDNEGNRVLQRSSTTAVGSTTPTVTDTITFDGYSEVVITGGTSTITNYFSVAGQRVAMRKGAILSYLLPDFLGSSSVALNFDGSIQAVQLYAPYGSVRYSDQVMPTSYNFTGQRLDSVTGLLYYNARYYDPVSGRFISSDTVQNNTKGMDSYAYVGDNPVVRTDPSGKCWPLCTMLIGAAIGAVVSVATTVAIGAIQGKMPSGGEIAQAAVTGAVAGAITGLAGPEAAPLARVAIGAVASGAGQAVGNAMQGKPIMDGVGQAVIVGGITGGAMELGGAVVGKIGGSIGKGAASALEGACSFTPVTPVTTDHGKQSIGTLRVGEKVLAYNPQTKKMELQPILHVWIQKDDDLVDLTITAIARKNTAKPTSEVIHTNKKHPFLTVEKGFLPVGQIRSGMHVVEADGLVGVISGWKLVPGVVTMYNLTVAHNHTFVVGDGQWIVHNVCLISGNGKYLTGPYQEVRAVVRDMGISDDGIPYQAHHIYQDAMMKDLPGYSREDAPSIALLGGSRWPGTPHDEANAFQNSMAGGLRFLREEFGTSTVSFDTATNIASDALTLGGVAEADLADIMGPASDYFTSQWSSGDLDNLSIPGGRGFYRAR